MVICHFKMISLTSVGTGIREDTRKPEVRVWYSSSDTSSNVCVCVCVCVCVRKMGKTKQIRNHASPLLCSVLDATCSPLQVHFPPFLM